MSEDAFYAALDAALQPDGARILLDAIAAGPDTAFVGGWVRDTLIGRASGDVDVATAEPEGLRDAMLAAGAKRAVCLDAERGTWRVVLPGGLFVDVCAWKGETLDEDLRARDLSLNAIAWIPGRGLVDPLGGADDLQRGRLVLASPTALSDDPLRALRVVRFAVRLGLQPSRELLDALATCDLGGIAAERIRAELSAILADDEVLRGVELLRAAGLLTLLPPCDPGRLAAARAVEWTTPSLRRVRDHLDRAEDGALIAHLGWLLRPPFAAADLTARRWPRKLAQRVEPIANTRVDAAPATTDRERAQQLVRWKCSTAGVLSVYAIRGGDAGVAPYLAMLDRAANRNPKSLPVPPLPRPLLPGTTVQARVGTGPQIADTLDALVVEQLLGEITTVEAAEAWLEAL